jgi:hypothetical protein
MHIRNKAGGGHLALPTDGAEFCELSGGGCQRIPKSFREMNFHFQCSGLALLTVENREFGIKPQNSENANSKL